MDRSRPDRPPEESAPSPEILHADAIGGEGRARDALAALCLPRVRRTVLLSVGQGPDLDDVTQTAMARVFSRLESFRGEAKFLTWVDRVTANVVKDHYRRRRWAVFISLDGDEPLYRQLVSPQEGPEDELRRQRLLERLAEHFARLRPKLRLPLVLSMVQGHTVPEIAEMLDLGTEATKKRLLRGRRLLIERVSRDPVCAEALRELAR